MLEKLQDARAVARAQPDAFVAGDDLLCHREGRSHDEGCEIEALVGCRGGEKTLFFSGRAEFDTIIAARRTGGHEVLAGQCSVRTMYGQADTITLLRSPAI